MRKFQVTREDATMGLAVSVYIVDYSAVWFVFPDQPIRPPFWKLREGPM